MPIGTSDGKYYEDAFDFFTNNGKEVIDPKSVMPPNTHPKIDEVHPDMMDPNLPKMDDYEMSAQKRPYIRVTPLSQDAPQTDINDRTGVISSPEVPNPTPDELNASGRGLVNKLTGADGGERYQLWPEKMFRDFATKFQLSGEFINQYLQGKVEYNDPNLVHAVTTLASTFGNLGLASAPLRTNSLGTFGGAMRASMLDNPEEVLPPNVLPVESLRRIVRSGIPEEDVTRLTGWWRDPADKRWKYEIPDKDAKLDTDYLSSLFEFGSKNKDGGQVSLGDLLEHQQLYKIYPELQNYKVIYTKDLKPVASFDEDTGTIFIGDRFKAYDADKQTGILLHEIQHGLQSIEGFARGGSPDATPSGIKASELEKTLKNLENLEDAFSNVPLQNLSDEEVTFAKDTFDMLIKARNQLKELKDKAYKEYREIPGEVEAHKVEENFLASKKK